MNNKKSKIKTLDRSQHIKTKKKSSIVKFRTRKGKVVCVKGIKIEKSKI